MVDSKLLLTAFVSAGAAVASAGITRYMDESTFQATLTAWNQAHFNGYAVDTVIDDEYSALGATFAGLGSWPVKATNFQYHDPPGTKDPRGIYCSSLPSGVAQAWKIMFSTPVRGVGFWAWDIITGNAAVKLYDSEGVLLDEFVIGRDPWLNQWYFDGFISTSADIARMEFHPLNIYGGQNMVWDHVQWGSLVVPAPGAALLGVIGVGLVGWVKRWLS